MSKHKFRDKMRRKLVKTMEKKGEKLGQRKVYDRRKRGWQVEPVSVYFSFSLSS